MLYFLHFLLSLILYNIEIFARKNYVARFFMNLLDLHCNIFYNIMHNFTCTIQKYKYKFSIIDLTMQNRN